MPRTRHGFCKERHSSFLRQECQRARKRRGKEEEIEMSVYPNVNTTVEVPKGTPNGTLFVDVGKTYGVGICDPATGKRVSLEDCARGYWKIQNLSQAHASRCNWIVARIKGRIKGVWKIDTKFGWKDSSLEAKPTWPSDQPFKQGEKREICRVLPDDAETVELRAKLIDKPVHLGRCFNTLRGYFC